MSTLYTGDSRFVLSGSDDGNVRIWKAHASDKLGIITARERAAIEYRESLKSRWKADTEINKISRYVSIRLPQELLTYVDIISILRLHLRTGRGTFRSRFTKPDNSSGLCSKQGVSRRSAAASTHARARASRRRRERRSSSPSSHSLSHAAVDVQEVFSVMLYGYNSAECQLLVRHLYVTNVA